eukprot:scaffold96728_cov67-Phaeocystis_antarctica.AAC.1
MHSWKAMLRASPTMGDLWCHGTRYVRHARGWYAYRVRTVRGASGKLPCASGTTARRRLRRV